MKIVIDTNVLMVALLKDSIIRKILSSDKIQFFLPEHALNEVEKYKEALSEKSNLSFDKIDELLNLVMENIEIIPKENIKGYIREAEKIMKNIDIKDSPFIAAALSTKSDGIFSFDNDFKKQTRVKVFSSSEIMKISR